MRYGRTGPGLSSFSREHACRGCPLRRGVGVLSGLGTRDVLHCPAYTYALQRAIPSARARFTSPSLHRKPVRYRNLDRLPISCALRLRLRPRLTLIRLTLIRNPWSCGVNVSHIHYRYLCLHLLFHALQRTSRHAFPAPWNAPLPNDCVPSPWHCFGSMLDTRLLSTPGRSTSELLRTL